MIKAGIHDIIGLRDGSVSETCRAAAGGDEDDRASFHSFHAVNAEVCEGDEL